MPIETTRGPTASPAVCATLLFAVTNNLNQANWGAFRWWLAVARQNATIAPYVQRLPMLPLGPERMPERFAA